MKKKIAILTQPLGKNYGGIIQNFALQEVLKRLGNEPITINRKYNKNLWLNLKIWLYHIIKQTGYKILSEKILKDKIFYHNYSFLKQHIALSEEIDSDRGMARFMNQHTYDVYIVGSDQTWRPKYSPNIYNYFLDFLEAKEKKSRRLAYASSFGTDAWEYTQEQRKRIKELVKQFNSVSVREDSGVHLCRKYLNVEAEHVLDPTMLLQREDYIRLLNLSDKDTAKGKLYTYVLDYSDHKQSFLDRCANEMRLELSNSQSKKKSDNYRKGEQLTDYVAPPLQSWLSGFKNAEFVITDSFHGTVFSIIFNKPFLVVVNENRGASRFYSLLENLGLQNRLITDVYNFNQELLYNKINYDSVNSSLKVLRAKSFRFLESNI